MIIGTTKTSCWCKLVLTICMILVLKTIPVAGRSPENTVKKLIVNIPSRTLCLMENEREVKIYSIAVGKKDSPTPVGHYIITSKIMNPTWYPPDGSVAVAPGKSNPLGSRWMGFGHGYGIHGNNNASSIGKAVSLGCIRLHNSDITELYSTIPIGTELTITYETINIVNCPHTNQTVLMVYPDIYGNQPMTKTFLKSKLAELEIDIEKLDKKMIADLFDMQFPFVSMYVNLGVRALVAGDDFFVNTKMIDGTLYVALRPVFEAFEIPFGWNSEKQSIVVENVTFKPLLVEGQSFINLSDLETFFGIANMWDQNKKLLEFIILKANVKE